ncbi:MAG: sulfite exporter TauE/SafE family protein [Ktedonobacteraceae bacterium]|nr:sulfite exporter TauE/SafE family protein [Ktedonobacteraceae bacterium]
MSLSLFSVSAAFLAGLVSFFSPCLLPLVPIYLAQLVGHSVRQSDMMDRAPVERLKTFLHALMFVLGFTLIFVALGATASELGRFLSSYLVQLRQVGGVILVIIGLHLTGLFRLPFLFWQKRFHFVPARPNFAASFLMGSIFALGWTPCISLFLSSILTLAASTQTLYEGIFLLFIYSLGIGVPFLLIGLGLNQMHRFLQWLKPHLALIEAGSGVMMIVMGILVFFNLLAVINSFFPAIGA